MAPSQSQKKDEIKKSKLLLTEGADAKYFCIWALEAYGVDDVQVIDFGGITELNTYLQTLAVLPGYEMVTTIVIARDAETRPSTAISNIKKAIKKASLSTPAKPYEFSTSAPRIAFMLFPGNDSTGEPSPGTLEDLCANIMKDTDAQRLGCVQAYLSCIEENGEAIKWRHKSFLHAYLAGENRYVGMKIGEASKAGAWNWEHESLLSFKNTIKAM